MEDAVDEAILEYRIYYNNLDPIIYIKIYVFKYKNIFLYVKVLL